MSDEEQPQAPPHEVPEQEIKSEDPNATINIKVRFCSRARHVSDEMVLRAFSELLYLVSSSGDEVFFKIKRNTKLSKLQVAYANKVGKDVQSIRYVFSCRGAETPPFLFTVFLVLSKDAPLYLCRQN